MVITSNANGILFDTPLADGINNAKKIFVPKSFINISKLSLFNTYVMSTNREGVDMMFNVLGVGESPTPNIVPVTECGGTTVTSIGQLFDLFIGLT